MLMIKLFEKSTIARAKFAKARELYDKSNT